MTDAQYRRQLGFEVLENRQLLAADTFSAFGEAAPAPDEIASLWTNPIIRQDVNADQSVGPIDLLLVINELNQNGSRSLQLGTMAKVRFWDVSGDGAVTPKDALQVLNHLRQEPPEEMIEEPPAAEISKPSPHPDVIVTTIVAPGPACSPADQQRRDGFDQRLIQRGGVPLPRKSFYNFSIDVSGDGKFTIEDLQLVMEELNKRPSAMPVYLDCNNENHPLSFVDVNADGWLTIADALRVHHALGGSATFYDAASEAELIALDASNELLPPPELVERIQRDLALIRQQHPYAQASMDYRSIWPGTITIELTPEAMEQLKKGEYEGLNDLNEHYGPVDVEPLRHGPLLLHFQKPYHSALLAQIYEAASGVVAAQPNYSVFEADSIVARMPEYHFVARWGDCPSGCIWQKEWIFRVENGVATLIAGDPTPPERSRL